jgi:cyclopropane fatty-acyl-phospholipid synthase-like methyltransferase
MSLSFWDGEYRKGRWIWGEHPGELAKAAVKYVREHKIPTEGKRLLDLGCGYGRDAFFLASQSNVRVVGVDSAEKAVELAESLLAEKESLDGKRLGVEFRRTDFRKIADGPFDLVYAANLYQILPAEERKQLCEVVDSLLAPDGLFFLGTLSLRDPEHAGKGLPVAGEENSWMDKTFVHLSTREELETNFRFLKFHRLFEHEFLEPRTGGTNHHHISWILIAGRSAGAHAGE